jgi:hypothetical protein
VPAGACPRFFCRHPGGDPFSYFDLEMRIQFFAQVAGNFIASKYVSQLAEPFTHD